MTEAGSQIAANPVDARRPGSVGRPVGLELRVVDGDRHPLSAGETGNVEIRGANVTARYWAPHGVARPPAGAAPDGFLNTGDLGWVDDDGYLYLVGRSDDVINRGGEKVQPREIEEVILADPRVSVAVVVGRPHPTVGEEPVAYVIAAPGEMDPSALARDLAGRCQAALSRFKWPAEVIVADALPAGPTGKVRRAEVRRLGGLRGPGPPPRGGLRGPGPPPRGGLRGPGPPPPGRDDPACDPPTPRRSSQARPHGLPLPRPAPAGHAKPRHDGLTMVIDNGLAQEAFADAIASTAAVYRHGQVRLGHGAWSPPTSIASSPAP